MDYQVLKNHPLAPYTTLKIGGPADTFVEANSSDQLVSILNSIVQNPDQFGIVNNFSAHSERERIEPEGSEHCKNSLTSHITILGNGSNVLISDTGVRGLVIKYSVPLQSIIRQTINDGYVGLENFAYIPASLGGAIVNNIHGVDKTNFNQYLATITVYDLSSSAVLDLQASDLKWDYDYSELQDKPHLVVLSATFNLQKGDKQLTLEKYNQIISQKSQNQPMNSAGCTFKNPPGLSAGQVIDQLGWKEKSVGGAQVSEKHANFIINTGNATAKDYHSLMLSIQSDVLAKKNIQLEPEIKLLGKF